MNWSRLDTNQTAKGLKVASIPPSILLWPHFRMVRGSIWPLGLVAFLSDFRMTVVSLETDLSQVPRRPNIGIGIICTSWRCIHQKMLWFSFLSSQLLLFPCWNKFCFKTYYPRFAWVPKCICLESFVTHACSSANPLGTGASAPAWKLCCKFNCSVECVLRHASNPCTSSLKNLIRVPSLPNTSPNSNSCTLKTPNNPQTIV